MSTIALLLLSALSSTISAQTPNGYIKVADNDYIGAGNLVNLRQDITTLPDCAAACDQDPLCQSILFTSVCFLYQIRRCMTPAIHTGPSQTDKGPIYEKNSPVTIPDGTQFVTVCGNYSGAVIDSYTTQVPARFGPDLEADVATFTTNCIQHCASLPNCNSWRVLEVYENNPNIPVDLRCTTYADSIYTVNHGTFEAPECKRARSKYANFGVAVSRPNCGASPGIGALADPITAAPKVGDLNLTLTDAPIIISGSPNVTTSPPSLNATIIPPSLNVTTLPPSFNTTTISPSLNASEAPSSNPNSSFNATGSPSLKPTTSFNRSVSSSWNTSTSSPWNISNSSTPPQSSKVPSTTTSSGKSPVTTVPVVGGGGGAGSKTNDTNLEKSAATGLNPILLLFVTLNFLFVVSAY